MCACVSLYLYGGYVCVFVNLYVYTVYICVFMYHCSVLLRLQIWYIDDRWFHDTWSTYMYDVYGCMGVLPSYIDDVYGCIECGTWFTYIDDVFGCLDVLSVNMCTSVHL